MLLKTYISLGTEKKVFPPTQNLPYIDTENMENNQLTLGTKVDKKIKTLLNTPTNKENK